MPAGPGDSPCPRRTIQAARRASCRGTPVRPLLTSQRLRHAVGGRHRGGEAEITGQVGDELIWRRWEHEQILLGLAESTPRAAFATGGLGALAVPPTVRIVVLPGDPASVTLPALDPKSVIPPFISLPGGVQLPRIGTIRGTSNGYVGFPDPGKGKPWPRFLAVHWHGGVDCYLGRLGGQDPGPGRDLPRLIWLRRTVGWAWGAFVFQQRLNRRYGVTGPFRVLLGVADTETAVLADVGTGWAEPEGPGSPNAPAAVDKQVLLHEDLAQWPDAAGVQALAMRFGARLDIAFGGPGDRYLDREGPDAGRFRPPQF